VVKVKVSEEPAWKRVLDIEVEAVDVDRELDTVVEEYRRRLVLPGFRKGKVPRDLAEKHLGEDLEGEVLRRILPRAVEDAIRDSELRPIGDPHLSNLRFEPGSPLTFTATLEVMPQVSIEGYSGLKLTRRQTEIREEDINQVLDRLRDQNADLEDVDRPAQGNDVVTIRYWEIDGSGGGGGGGGGGAETEPQEMTHTVGGEHTPESFSRELMGTVVGDMKKVPLAYPVEYPDEALAGRTRRFHVTVGRIQEKVWPALDDAFARKVLENEESALADLRSRVRLNLEVDARMRSVRELENNLVQRLLERNAFEVPRGIVESTLNRIVLDAKREGQTIPPDQEVQLKEQYRPAVESRYRADILIEAVGRQEGIEVTDEDLDKEIDAFAREEGKPPAQVKGRLRKEGHLERLRNDLFRRRVIDTLVEKADITVTKVGGEEDA
jgi:trigger factor